AARPEAVLDGPDNRVTAAGVAFEIEYGVDHVLDDPRTGNGAFLRHVSDEKKGDVSLLGKLHDASNTLAQLGDGTRRGRKVVRRHGLDRVDDYGVGFGRR